MYRSPFRVSRPRTRRLVVWLALAILLIGPLASVGEPLAPPGAKATVGGSTGAGAHPRPVPFLPVHVRTIGVTVPATIDPTAYYSSEPAPMGIGDFGVGVGGHPYTYDTSEFLGNFSWQHLNVISGGDAWFTNQLNVVLQFVQDSTTYAYWIQDVAIMNSTTGELYFEDNIWNFTTSSYCLDSSALSGNGTVYGISGCEGYYAVVADFSLPGSDEFMPSPGDFSLLARSYLSAGGLPEVAFEYWDGVTSYEVTYDNVVWPWATSATDNNFHVDGNVTAPSGNFYDAELTLGGPGGGSSTTAQSVTDAASRLLYWNGNNFEAPRAVWNFGSDTAESISNVQSVFSHDSGGTPLTAQLNGTARNATPALAYDQGRVGVLSVSAPALSGGTVSVAGTLWKFNGDQATLTLVPGAYAVWVNGSSSYSLGVCGISGGVTIRITLPGSCGPLATTPVATPSSADVGQSVTFQTTVLSPGSGGDTFDWGSLAAGLGCTPSTSDAISCQPGTSGAYSISVTITDSDGQSSTTGTLSYVVYSDPTVGTPVASPTSVTVGDQVTFTVSASGGSGGYGFAWAGLPGPCSSTSTASPVCHPANPGAYKVSVAVTDSNGFTVTSSTLDFTVNPAPLAAKPTATPAGPIDLGASVAFSSGASGGVSPYTYVWQDLPAGCSSANFPSISCVPSSSGTSAVTVTVTDADGDVVTGGPLSFTVNPALEVQTASSSPPSIDLGQNATLSALGVSGGGGTYAYAWSGLPPGCASVDRSSFRCIPDATGTFRPMVIVSDSDGGSANATATLTVLSEPAVSGISPSLNSTDVGESVTYTADGVTGGTGNYSYAWTDLPTGCLTQNSESLACIPTSAGNFSLVVVVTDTNHGSATSSPLAFTVYPALTATLTVSPSTVRPSSNVTFVASVSGGAGGTTVVWSGLPPGCPAPSTLTVTCSPSAAGQYQVTIEVTDRDGGHAVGETNLSVATASSGLSSLEVFGAVALGGVGVVAVLAGIVAFRRRKRAAGSAR